MSNSAFILTLGSLSGDVSTVAGSGVATLATVNANVGTFGNSTNIPVITVNAKGLITAVSNTSITVGTGSVTSIVAGTGLTGGTITNTGTIALGTSGVTAGTYTISTVVVDSFGRVTSASNGTVAAGTTVLTGDVTGSGVGTVATTLAASGATAGTYGGSTAIPIITVNAKGLITAISSTSVNVPSGTINLTGDVSGTGQTGTALSTVLANSGVTAGTYGSNTTTNTITVDAKGRITNISTSAISTAVVPYIAGAGSANNALGGSTSLAIGSNAAANQPNTIAIGRAPAADGTNSIAIGDNAITTGDNSIVIGQGTTTQNGQIIIGYGTNRIYVNGTTGALTANNLSGTNTGDQTITLIGDATGSGTGSFAITLGSVVAAGTYNQVVVGTKGLVVSGTNIAFGSIASQSASNVNITGGTITGLSNPVVVSDAATKGYVDGLVQGLNAKLSVRVATVVSETFATAFTNGQTVDGVVLATGNRILIKNQSTPSQNGIYTVNASGAPTRTSDGDTWAELVSAFVFVEEGTINADTGWTCIVNQGGTLGTTDVVWAQFSGAGSYSADGSGIIQTGSVFGLQLNGTTLSKSASGLQIAVGGVSNNEISASAAIALSKLAAIGTNNVVLVSNGSGVISPSTISTTTLGYLDATSSIQTQLDTKLTANQNITVSGDASGSGSTAIALVLANSGVVAGTGYNTFTVDAKGRVTSASTVVTGTGSVTSIITGTGLNAGTITNTGTIALATSGVTAGTYGSSTNIPVVTIDSLGRITSATTAAISIPSGTINLTGDVTGTGQTGTAIAATISANSVTYNKIQNTSGSSILLGRSGISAGVIQELTIGNNLSVTAGTLNAATPGTGTVTSLSVSGANGITVTGSPVTNSGTIGLALGAITPTSVAATGAVSGSNLSGTNTGDQTITLTGDVTGTGTGSFTTTLANSGVVAGTGYNTVTVNAKGLVTAASTTAYLTANQAITVTGDVTGSGSTALTLTLGTSGATAGTYGNTTNIPTVVVNAKGLVTSISNNAVTIGTGTLTSVVAGTDLTGGTITNTGTINLATSGVTAGTGYNTFTVNAKGIVTAATTTAYGTGTVTSVVTGTGLTGGTITNTGTIALGTSGVTAGTYNQVTVDALGRVTAGTTIAAASTSSNARTVTQTTHGFAVNNLLRLNGTSYTLAQADSVINAEVVGIVTTVVDANNFVLTTDGYVTGLSGLTAGSAYFLSPTTAGLLTVTIPTTAGQVVKPVLVADTATSGYFNNLRGQVIASVDVVSSRAPTRSTLTATTTTTYTTPAGCSVIIVKMVGAGGGGAAATTNAGTAGSPTVFGSVSAAPGGGGTLNGGTGALGGTGGTGTLGSTTRFPGSGAASSGGPGASSVFGGGGRAPGNGVGGAGSNGAGGANGNNGSLTSGVGGPGGAGEYVEMWISSPAASYSYNCGVGGAGGAAGGQAGGAGGNGIIIVEEYYG